MMETSSGEIRNNHNNTGEILSRSSYHIMSSIMFSSENYYYVVNHWFCLIKNFSDQLKANSSNYFCEQHLYPVQSLSVRQAAAQYQRDPGSPARRHIDLSIFQDFLNSAKLKSKSCHAMCERSSCYYSLH